MPSPREGEQPFAFGCKGCGRVAKTERDLLAAGCEGTHEPLVFQSALTEAEEALRPGDQMQSALSRLCDFVLTKVPEGELPYEVHMAALEGESAVKDWTEFRRKGNA